MTRSWKCFIILLAGLLILLLADALTDCRGEMFPFVGSLIPLAVIVSAIAGDKKSHQKMGSGILLWGGIAALFIHILIYNEPGAQHPENWRVDIACFIQGAILSLLIYHLKTAKTKKVKRPHRDVQPTRL